MRLLGVFPGVLHYSKFFLRLEPIGLELVAEAARQAGHEGDKMGNIDRRCSAWPPVTRRVKIEDRRNHSDRRSGCWWTA